MHVKLGSSLGLSVEPFSLYLSFPTVHESCRSYFAQAFDLYLPIAFIKMVIKEKGGYHISHVIWKDSTTAKRGLPFQPIFTERISCTIPKGR